MSIVEKAVDKHRRSEPQQRARPEKPVDDARPMAPVIAKGVGGEPDVRLDQDELAREGVTVFGKEGGRVADEFRRLKRPLLSGIFSAAEGENLQRRNLILVSSALSGEGKTFTALNLAMSIALERDRTVVLVDADVAKPHISRLLGIEEKPGLLDLLKDERLDVSEVLLQTDMSSLKIIPAGQRDQFATEILASQRMVAIATELADRYPDRIILFDSPPLLQTSEAQVLAGLMGQILVVVHAGQTPQKAVGAALELLGETPTRLILNKSRMSKRSDYYSGYYQDYGDDAQ